MYTPFPPGGRGGRGTRGPPGSRFDPYGPPPNPFGGEPDFDELPPPGYNDMFM